MSKTRAKRGKFGGGFTEKAVRVDFRTKIAPQPVITSKICFSHFLDLVEMNKKCQADF